MLLLVVLLAASAPLAQTQQIETPTDPAAACSPAQQRKATRCSKRYEFWVEQSGYSAPTSRPVLQLAPPFLYAYSAIFYLLSCSAGSAAISSVPV